MRLPRLSSFSMLLPYPSVSSERAVAPHCCSCVESLFLSKAAIAGRAFDSLASFSGPRAVTLSVTTLKEGIVQAAVLHVVGEGG